jgi:ParB family chromosome partitioning protein
VPAASSHPKKTQGTLRYVTEVIMADPAGLAAGDGDRVASLVGKETHPGAWDRTAAVALASGASDARLPLVLLAQVAASVEARFGERQGWRHPTSALATYLRFLAACGYGLSEVEQEVANTKDGSESDE